MHSKLDIHFKLLHIISKLKLTILVSKQNASKASETNQPQIDKDCKWLKALISKVNEAIIQFTYRMCWKMAPKIS